MDLPDKILSMERDRAQRKFMINDEEIARNFEGTLCWVDEYYSVKAHCMVRKYLPIDPVNPVYGQIEVIYQDWEQKHGR